MTRVLAFCAAVAALTLASCGGGATDLRIASATQEVIVTPANAQGWSLLEYDGGTVGYAPSPAPLAGGGAESLALTAGAWPSGAEAMNWSWDGYKVAALHELSYWTYVTQYVSGQAPYLIINVDLDDDGFVDKSLWFEPVYQTGGYPGDAVPNQGPVALNTWQKWDALAGGWWDSPDEDPALGPWDVTPHYGPPVYTLATIIADHPDAVLRNTEHYAAIDLVGGYGVQMSGYADLLTVGFGDAATTYNFEVSTVDDCQKGGWKSLGYRNQGDCVSAHASFGHKGQGRGPRNR